MRNKSLEILLKFILPIYLLALAILTLYRVVFIYLFLDDFMLLYKTSYDLYPILIKAMTKGFRYDNIVLSYTFAIPIVTLLISCLIDTSKLKLIFKGIKIYIIVVLSLIFALSCIDFPYFKYFWGHPTITLFDWLAFSGTFGMLVQESSYYIYYLIFFISLGILILAMYLCSKWINGSNISNKFINNKFVQTALFSLAFIICFFGTRGHLSVRHIGLDAAYFTDNKLVSDLCITPAYYFISHLDDYQIDFADMMDSDTAIKNVQNILGIRPDSTIFKNPISRKIFADSTRQSLSYNIVLVFMESFSSNHLFQKNEDGHALTPFLDSLTQCAYYFKNIYSSGVHTNAGVGSTLISYPSELNKHMMGRNPISYNSVLPTLKNEGYKTMFFLPNEEVYDNMGLFLRANYIDTIFSDNHYPKEKKVNNFGVPDDFLLNFAVKEISKQEEKDKPFFASILTVSNHPPYIVPNSFLVSNRNNEQKAMLAYVDHSIRNFMEEASKQTWFDNTVFVFFGDHGKLVGAQVYNMSISYNHIPLIVYCPQFKDMPQVFPQYGGQIDILPTLMGILNKSHINSTLGVDLIREKRPYMFFTSDTQIGCINDEYFFTFHPKTKDEYLYTLNDNINPDDETLSQQKEAMKGYAISMLATTQYMRENELVTKK